jgi:hypothetical protein
VYCAVAFYRDYAAKPFAPYDGKVQARLCMEMVQECSREQHLHLRRRRAKTRMEQAPAEMKVRTARHIPKALSLLESTKENFVPVCMRLFELLLFFWRIDRFEKVCEW